MPHQLILGGLVPVTNRLPVFLHELDEADDDAARATGRELLNCIDTARECVVANGADFAGLLDLALQVKSFSVGEVRNLDPADLLKHLHGLSQAVSSIVFGRDDRRVPERIRAHGHALVAAVDDLVAMPRHLALATAKWLDDAYKPAAWFNRPKEGRKVPAPRLRKAAEAGRVRKIGKGMEVRYRVSDAERRFHPDMNLPRPVSG